MSVFNNSASDGDSLHGHPVSVVNAINKNGRSVFDLDTKALESILLSDKVRDKKVAVVSVAGAFRRGKSFLLDFFLRYLDAGQSATWLGDANSPLKGFPWRGGAERETTGILLWSEPFICKTSSGEEVAVILMDTQGAFDSHSTVKECATVFALSTMLSSIQVYNISNNIQEDNLQHLQLFTEYGRLAQENGQTESTPFQNLEFLVRDWSFPYEYEFGEEGGTKILNNRLKICESQHAEHQQIRRHIWSCFRRIGCFLMPHPGLKVATNPRFDGRLADIDSEFVTQLKRLVPLLLSPEKLVVKEINGSKVTCRELLEYFKAYIKIYQGDDLPEPKTMLMATAEANNLAALAKAKDLYIHEMEKICGGELPYISPDVLEAENLLKRAEAIKLFSITRKMGGEEFSAQYKEQLESEIESIFEQMKLTNQSKNLLAGFRTPLIILTCTLISYLLSGILDFIGLDPVANLLGWFIWIFIVALSTWVYVNQSGNYPQMGENIDMIFDFIHDNVLYPIYLMIAHKTAKRVAGVNFNSASGVKAKKSSRPKTE